jgi:hypothetical protein
VGAGHDPASRMVQRLAHRPFRWVRESRCESVIALSHRRAEGGSEADSSRSYEATAVPYEQSGCEPSGTARETQGPRASGVGVPRGDGSGARRRGGSLRGRVAPSEHATMVGVVNARLVGVSVVCVAVCDSSVSRLRGRAGVDGGDDGTDGGAWAVATLDGNLCQCPSGSVSSCPARPAFLKTSLGDGGDAGGPLPRSVVA